MPEVAARLTYEDLARLPEDGLRHELIDGEHVVNAAPAPRHQIVASNLSFALNVYVRERRLGRVLDAPIDVVFSAHDVVQPDLVFISIARQEVIGDKSIVGAPDLVVEILSESTRKRDEITKRNLYERYAVSEYWVVDPVLESVKVYRLVADRYQRVAELSTERDESLTSALFPGLTIALHEIFA
jgi:Uma2 family endonuclease